MIPTRRGFTSMVLLFSMVVLFQPAGFVQGSEADRLFTLKVLPLLKTKCFGCHGGDPNDIRGEYDLVSREGMLKGGESEEPSLVPGHPEDSILYQAVMWDGYEMPPKENDRLTREETEYFREWIAAGAPWPDAETQRSIAESEWAVRENEDGVIVDSSGGLADDWTYRRYQPEDIWAFRPVSPVDLASVKPADQHPVDFFIEQKMSEAAFEPAAQADPKTLIRRATLDLLGLPPTPQEMSAFLSEWEQDSEKAWNDLIDRLLESPHYGERWAQHWLDVTRYADTAGYSNDYERSNMWRYRDYVIRAFNNDKPYNEFILEQLAGDEIVERQKEAGRRPNGDIPPATLGLPESELLVATGFLRMGPWDPAMVKNPEARQLYLDDVVNSVGQTFLATTMRCFKCHDHKFDPLPTRDYYRVYAAFSGTQLAERPAEFLPEENLDGFEEGRAHVERLLEFARAEKEKLIDKRETAARKWYEENDLPYLNSKDRKDAPDEMKPPRHVGLDYVEQGKLKVREQDEWIWNRRLERYQPMVQSVYNGPDPKYLNARKLRMPGKVKEDVMLVSHILTGGSLEAPGEEVLPGVLSALDVPVDESADDPYVIGNDLQGRRLTLAKWIANPNNPLTTRSIVNRIWQYHFGKPIAGNPNNFGVKGAKPTHPELLDWLASDFVAGGWQFKRIHKLIMTSETYLQASSHRDLESLQTADPNNDLLAYFPTRRLTAEELRDAMLLVTGELNPAVGGLPVMPEINMEVALQPRMIQFSLAPAYQPSPTPERRNRRSIYAYRVRGQADPFLEVFNQPNPNESCELRDAASVSPQAFSLMNSELMNDRAIAFASSVRKEAESTDGQIKRAFQRAFGRAPAEEVRQRMVAYVQQMRDYHAGTQPQKPEYPTAITRSLVEEFSGRPFEYEEILPAFESYVPDQKAADVDAETRALADLCLMLFNTNEFIYVY
ncbi:MAG: PSD1 and planctomycete cytochrome C domain-containing protein [Planctomycetota bacterium]